MLEKITSDDVTVQIEASSEDTWVPYGLAVPTGRYNEDEFTETVLTDKMRARSRTLINLDLGAWKKMTGYTLEAADTSEFPNTNIVNNSLVVLTRGLARVRIVWVSNFEYSGFSPGSAPSIRLMKNGQVRGQAKPYGYVRLSDGDFRGCVIEIEDYLKPGDTFYVEAMGGGSGEQNKHKYSLMQILPVTDTPNTINLERDMLYKSQKSFNYSYGVASGWGGLVSTSYLTEGLPRVSEFWIDADVDRWVEVDPDTGEEEEFEDWDLDFSVTQGSAAGPVLAQNRVPIPVDSGDKVNMSGQFRVRRPDKKTAKDDNGMDTAIDVRFSLWGIGVTSDEYGVESLNPVELMFYQATLQPAPNTTGGYVQFTLPTIPDATIPAGVTGVYFTCSLVQASSGSYSGASFVIESGRKNESNVSPDAPNPYAFSYFGWADANPLKVRVTRASAVSQVWVHPLSMTGVAFKNRSIYENIKPPTTLAVMGRPDQAINISVYNTDGTTRGTLIGNFPVAAGERKVYQISSVTGTKIEIVEDAALDFYVEFVLNDEINTLTYHRTRSRKIDYLTITDDITKISILQEEAGTGSCTIDFATATLDPRTTQTLSIGKRVRVLGRHYGETDLVRPAGWSGEALYSEVFTGTLRKVNSRYDYMQEAPIVQIIAYDTTFVLENTESGVGFDAFERFGPVLTSLGTNVFIDGYNWGGKRDFLTNLFKYSPSIHGEFPLIEGLSATRNTVFGHWYVNKKDELILRTESGTTSKLALTDGTLSGELNYGGKVKRSFDTMDQVNVLELNERMLDREEYINRGLNNEAPPFDSRYPQETNRTATFRKEELIEQTEEISRSFDIILGDGNLANLYYLPIEANPKAWAERYFQAKANLTVQFREVTVPIKSSKDIYNIARLELLDLVDIHSQGTTTQTRVREIEHTIIPGKWFCELKFKSTGDMSDW